jgi:DNA (cytosine-5)-methyltransferase 1
MRVLSVFTGVGGFDLGAIGAGLEVVGQVEIDKNCQTVLRHHFPDVPLHDDISTAIEWAKENDLDGRVDIVAGGFPCQDVSVAGKRAGIAGSRSGLFWEALRLTKEIGAHTIILENVPGLLSSNEGRDFAVIVTALADSGYRHIEWRVLDSQFFGVPQRRRRVFIVATSRNRGSRPILVEREGMRGHHKTSNQERQDPAGGAVQSSGQTGFAKYSAGVTTLTASTYKRPEDNVVVHLKQLKTDGKSNLKAM